MHPPALCHAQIEHPNIRLIVHHQALELRRIDDQWQVWDDAQLIDSAPVVVLAGAADIKQFSQSADLPLKRIRGQITRLAQTQASTALRTVVCAGGYVAPARLGEHTLGASFDFNSTDLTPNLADHLDNLGLLREISQDLTARLEAADLPPGVARRFAAPGPDYFAIVGPLADREAFVQAYAALGKDARQVPDIACPWLDGLYVNSGHGSRGLITAPLSAELIAAWLDNEPLPLPRSVAEACHPNRFALRGLIRGGGK